MLAVQAVTDNIFTAGGGGQASPDMGHDGAFGVSATAGISALLILLFHLHTAKHFLWNKQEAAIL